jgi:hypothetical protein
MVTTGVRNIVVDRDLAMISRERITIVTVLGTIGATAAVTASVMSVSRRETVTVVACAAALTARVGFETMRTPVRILVATVSTRAIEIARRPQIARRFLSNPAIPERVPTRSDAERERQRI